MNLEPLSDREQALYITRGNAAAADCLMMLTKILYVWDDLIDRDKPVADEAINQTFFWALVDLPSNPFFVAHRAHLIPVIANSITNWHAANEMERNTTHVPLDLEIAFIIRSEYINILIEIARICGGNDWAREAAVDIRRSWHSEGFATYKNSLQVEKEIRNAGM